MRTRPCTRAGGRAAWGLLALGIVLLFIAMVLVQVLRSSTVSSRSVGHACRQQLNDLGKGIWSYVIDYDRFFPLAWHVAGPSLADDLSNVSYHRFLIAERVTPDFRRLVTPDDVARHNGDRMAARRDKFRQADKLWNDPGIGGWTRDYFGPATIFRWPGGRDEPALGYTNLSAFTEADITDQALLADVNASLPNPDAKDPDDPEHEAEMRKGFSFVRESGMDVFVGAGPSLRRKGDLSSSRLDFRHKGAANILFLDGHVEMVSKTNAERLERIHRNWNSLEGTMGEPRGSPPPAP